MPVDVGQGDGVDIRQLAGRLVVQRILHGDDGAIGNGEHIRVVVRIAVHVRRIAVYQASAVIAGAASRWRSAGQSTSRHSQTDLLLDVRRSSHSIH